MDIAIIGGVGVALFCGSFLQRVTGMGLALVASPLLVLLLDATAGVQLVQAVGLVVCLVSAAILRRHINLRRTGILLLAATFGLVPGVWVARVLPGPWLTIVIGGVTLLALAGTIVARRIPPTRKGPPIGVAGTGMAGALSGFMNVTAGVGGPPIVIYATITQWKYAEYVATVQLYFAGLDALSLVSRGLPSVSWPIYVTAAVAAVLGIMVGNQVGSRLSEDVGKRIILVVALLGSLAIVLRGALELYEAYP